MMNHQTLLAGYVRDMLSVENEMHQAFRRQKHDDRLNIHPESARLIARIEDTIDRHLGALRHGLAELGADQSSSSFNLKQTLSSVLGAAAGIYNGMRSEDPVSRMLRDDYIALSTAIVCYEMLHTTALACQNEPVENEPVAELALAHLKDYAPLVMAISEILPHAVVEELSREGKLPASHGAAEQAVKNTREAWMEGSEGEPASA
jgi:hypothetical protein